MEDKIREVSADDSGTIWKHLIDGAAPKQDSETIVYGSDTETGRRTFVWKPRLVEKK
jgi:hypothetical protein